MCPGAECRVVFAHQGIYVAGKLFCWVGKEGVAIMPKKAIQRGVLQAAGCRQELVTSHRSWGIPTKVLTCPKELGALANAYAAAS